MKYIDADNNVFKNETMILEQSMNEINKYKAHGSIPLEKFVQLAKNYRDLLKLSKKVFKISDFQGKELNVKTNEINTILNNSNQGFLTFGENLKVNKQYSSECIKIFNKKISGMDIASLLAIGNSQIEENFNSILKQVFHEPVMEKKKTLLKNLPRILHIGNSFIDIRYRVINQGNVKENDDLIMMILTDIKESQKAEDQVVYLSYHDKLTSLYNRVYMESIMPQLESASAMPLSLVMADMNGLKLTNDVFGHENGDKLLVHAARILKNCLRKSDYIARWGGDEFLIILPNTDTLECKNICRRIKAICGEAEAGPIEISLSLGSATIENTATKISELLNIADNRMYRNKLVESKQIKRKIVMGMEKVLHTKCFEDPLHVERVQKMAANFVKFLDLNTESMELKKLPKLVALHDIGKIAIPKEILSKSAPLTDNEWEIVKSYTEIGFRMAQSIDEAFIAENILTLREKWDGTGYPYGLKHEAIPYIARVLSIVESFDVMTHPRPYKSALSKEKALQVLKINGGKQFDPTLVDLFLKNIDEIMV
ncbi:diguanylate cyclase [Clostridiaceae bacterium 35-E11]